MKIQTKNKTIFIADDSPTALKIVQGFDFSVTDDNDIVVKDTKSGIQNRYQVANAIKGAATIQDLKAILLKMTDLLDEVLQ